MLNIIGIDDMLGLLFESCAGNVEATLLAQSAAQFIPAVMRASPGEILCMTCDQSLCAENLPASIVVAQPATPQKERDALVSGLCPECERHPQRDARILDALRKIWPDLVAAPIHQKHGSG